MLDNYLKSKYFVLARLLPAIICSMPFLILYFYFLNTRIQNFFDLIFKIQWFGDITSGVAFLFLFTLIGRFISKDIFEKLFYGSDHSYMPTVNFLLYFNREYSNQYKNKVHRKIKTDFDIDLFTPEQEQNNEIGARKTATDAVGLILQKVKEGHLLLNFNIEYGFMRNLIGCSVISVIFSIVNLIIFGKLYANSLAFKISLVCLIVYLIPIILSKIILDKHSKRFAKALYREYLEN